MDIYRLVDPTPRTDKRLPGLERAPQTRIAKHRETVSSWQIPSTRKGPVSQLSGRTCLLVPWGIAPPPSSHPRGQARLQRSRTLRRPLSLMPRSQTTLWRGFPEGRPQHMVELELMENVWGFHEAPRVRCTWGMHIQPDLDAVWTLLCFSIPTMLFRSLMAKITVI